MLMRKPKKFKTAKFILGVNVEGKDIVDVPLAHVKDFVKLGFKPVKVKKEEDNGTKGNKAGR